MTYFTGTGARRGALRFAALVAVLVPLAAAGCGRKAAPAGAGAPGGAGKPGVDGTTAITVTAAPAERRDISKTVDVTGSLVAQQDVVVGTKLAGKVAAVYLREGEPVRAGQVVATMDTADYRAQLLQAQAGLQAAVTKEEQARTALQQAQDTLANARTTLRWTDQTTKAGVATAQAGLQSAQAGLDVVREGARPQERKQAEDQVSSAKASYDKAKSDLKRYQGLYREQAVSALQLDQAQAAYDAAEAAYSSAQQALSLVHEGARTQDITRAELAVKQAQEGLARAQADRAQVRMRQQDVATAQSGIAVAQASIRASQAGVVQARAQLKLAQDALANAAVVSPIGGYVAERRAEPGQQLGGGGPVMRVVNPQTVYLEATLSETQYGQVVQGQHVQVKVDAIPGRTFDGRVSRILPVASSARSFTVRVDIGGDPRLRPQMFARGGILIDTHRAATLVPKDAVIFDPSSSIAHVFVVGGDGKAHKRAIEVGYTNPLYVEATSGIRPGDRIVTAGQSNLDDGDAIRVAAAQAQAPSADGAAQ